MAGESDRVLNLYKKRSETPLQTIERYVKAHPEFAKVKMTYAGRLDPMAEGLLLVLTGEKNKERESYTGLDKEYEFEFALGVETDTHDLLGLVAATKGGAEVPNETLGAALRKYSGTFEQNYPAYSSKVVDGAPMFEHARKGSIDSIAMPKHAVRVDSIAFLSSRVMTKTEFWAYIKASIDAVTGDFRQKAILAAWERYLSSAQETFTIYKAHVACGSGFYVRQLVSDLGRDLGTGAVTVSILRTRVGDFKLTESI